MFPVNSFGVPKGRRLAVAVGLTMIGVSALLETFASSRPAPAARMAVTQQWAADAARASNLLASPDPEGTRLYQGAVAPAGAEGAMSLDDFIGLLEQKVPKPVAQKVAKEFMKEPKLKQAWQAYRIMRGDKAPAKNFVDFITRIPQFRQLMAKFQSDPGFKQAFNDAAKQKEINAVLRGGLRNVASVELGTGKKSGGGRIGPSGKASDVEAIKREWEQKAKSGIDLSGYQMAGVGPFAGAREMTTAGMISHPSAAGGNPATGGGPTQSALGDNLGGGQRNTKELDKSWQANAVDDKGKEQFDADRRLLTKLMKSLTDDERKKIEAAMCINPAVVPCNPTIDHDIWGACWSSGLLERCKALCSEVAGCAAESGEKMENSFAACRAGDARKPEECIRACKDQTHGYACAGGDIDAAEWTAACEQKAVPDPSYCSDTMYYGPCADPASGACVAGTWDVAGDGPSTAAGGPPALDPATQQKATNCIQDMTSSPDCAGLLRALADTADLSQYGQNGTQNNKTTDNTKKTTTDTTVDPNLLMCKATDAPAPSTFFESALSFLGGTAQRSLTLGIFHKTGEDVGGAIGRKIDDYVNTNIAPVVAPVIDAVVKKICNPWWPKC